MHLYKGLCTENLYKLDYEDNRYQSSISTLSDDNPQHIRKSHDAPILHIVFPLDILSLLMLDTDSHTSNYGKPHLRGIAHLLYIQRVLVRMLIPLFHSKRIHYDKHIQVYDFVLHIFDFFDNFEIPNKDYGID